MHKLSVSLGNLGGNPRKAWMGVKMEPLDPPLALALGLVNSNGAFILEATPAGPAAQGRLRFGDVIAGLDGKPLSGVADLRQHVASSVPGSRLDLEVWRVADDGDVAGMLRRLADAGNAYIMYRLGRMYAFGTGVGRDEREAVRWYRQGAAAGNAAAMTALAAAVLEGRGTDSNSEEGLGLLQAAIDKGSLEAMYAMGAITLDGKLVARNPQEALRLFT
jgi:TPR repeat protein